MYYSMKFVMFWPKYLNIYICFFYMSLCSFFPLQNVTWVLAYNDSQVMDNSQLFLPGSP